MNRIYLLIITLFMMLASCSNSNDDVEQGENGNTNKESIVALWQDSDKNLKTLFLLQRMALIKLS